MFQLSDSFLEPYKTAEVDWGPVGEITFLRTYSRDGESWWETCRRAVQGCYFWQRIHCIKNNRPWSDKQALHSAQEMYDLMFHMKFLPPGRGLRNMGSDVVWKKGGAALNNCGFVSTSDIADAAAWAADMLMLGVGVGFDTLGAGTEIYSTSSCGACRVEIPDTREGWVESIRELLDSYLRGGNYIAFDYSKIRAEGEPIAGSGGIASGPGPLIELHKSLRKLLDQRIVDSTGDWADSGTLTSADINDIMALIGRCVVSGGVRRSAEISFIEPGDFAAYDLKDKKLYPEENNNYRWAANHSVKCIPGETDYFDLVERTKNVDELGVFWLKNAQEFGRMGRRKDYVDSKAAGCNPCAEQTLEHKELCCLVEIFPSRIESMYEFQKVLKYAYLYAKTVTTIEVHDKESQDIIKRNRRIGCSLTGIQQAINQKGSSEFYRYCSEGYKYLKQLDRRYSEWLGIQRSCKITSVKPSGTVSKLPGVSSGIHFPVSRSYFQVIRFASSSPYLKPLKSAGYRVVDLSPNEPNTTAVYFGVIEDDFSRAENEVSIWEQAEHAAKLQHYWADNQVSITVKYSPTERAQLPYLLAMYEDRLKAISFFPHSDLHNFDHAPWQPASEEEVRKYIDNLAPVNYSGGVHENDDKFCEGETCLIK